MKVLQIIIAYVNFIFMTMILRDCFLITDEAYLLYSTVLFFIAAAIYLVLEAAYRKNRIVIIPVFLFVIVLIIYIVLIELIDNKIFYYLLFYYPSEITNMYNSLRPIDFKLILPYMIIGQPLLAIMFCTFAALGKNKIQVCINIILMVSLWFWHYQGILESYAIIYAILAVFTCIFDNYYYIYSKVEEKGSKKFNKIISALLCAVFISVIVVSILNNVSLAHSGKYSSYIYEKINNIGTSINTYSDSSEHKFSGVNSIAEPGKEKIGGSIQVDSSPVFEVKSNKPLYLKAAIKNKYNDKNNTWYYGQSNSNFIPRNTFIYDNKYVDDKNLTLEKKAYSTLRKTKVEKSKLEIYDYSSNIFYPYYIYSVDNVDTNFSLFQGVNKAEGGNVNDSETCNITYYDYEDEITLDKAYTAGIGKGMIFSNDGGKTTFSENDYKNYKLYNSDYLNGYSDVDKRIVQLTRKIVKGSKSDAEKAYKIEQYLKSNYVYSLNVSNVNNDLLYNFLFNEKRGYCVYFATAMTVMCMIANVPARYVEGVKMTDRKDEKGNYVVTNEDAHAWTEVMINPKSNIWYIADATPTVAEYYAKKENINQINDNSTSYNNLNNSSTNKEVSGNAIDKKASQTKKVSKSISRSKTTNVNLYKYDNLIKVIIILSLILVLRIAYKIYIIRRVINGKSTIPLYTYCIRRLKCIGIQKHKQSSEIEFAENIVHEEISKIMRKIATETYVECYSDNKACTINKKEVYNKFEACIKSKQNLVKYYLWKYL